MKFPFLLFCIFYACSLEKQKVVSRVEIASSEVSQLANFSAAEETRKDPQLARVRLAQPLSLEDSKILKGYESPILRVSFEDSDFYQLIRCAQSYTFRDDLGSLYDPQNAPVDQGARESAWNRAISGGRSCQWVGTKISAKIFADLSAQNGNFYYVINPCYSKDNSLTYEDACSYRLIFTSSLEFKNELLEEIRSLNLEISSAESDLNGTLMELQTLTSIFVERLKSCEQEIAKRTELNIFRRGLILTGFFIGFGLAGSLVMGPGSFMMLGGLSNMVMSQLLTGKMDVKNVSPLLNTCMKPPDAASVVGTTGNAKRVERDLKRAVNTANEIEANFQVQSALQRLDQLQQILASQLDRLQTLYMRLQAMDYRTMSINDMIMDAQKNGIDLGDPSTYPGGQSVDTTGWDPQSIQTLQNDLTGSATEASNS